MNIIDTLCLSLIKKKFKAEQLCEDGRIKINGKWGVLDENLQKIIVEPFAYNILKHGEYILKTTIKDYNCYKWGLLDLKTGKIIRKAFATFISQYNGTFKDKTGLIGIIDTETGKIITKPFAHNIENNGRFQIAHCYGLIDMKNGKIIKELKKETNNFEDLLKYYFSKNIQKNKDESFDDYMSDLEVEDVMEIGNEIFRNLEQYNI